MLTLMFTLMLGDDVGVEMAPEIMARKCRNAHYNRPGFSIGFTACLTLMSGDDFGVKMAPEILPQKWQNAH